MPAEEAARALFALRTLPAALARALLEDVVACDARLAWRGSRVGLSEPPGRGPARSRTATFVVVDLETTGLRPGAARICEIGAVRSGGSSSTRRSRRSSNPGRPLPAADLGADGDRRPRELRGAPPVELAVRRFLAFAGDAVLVAHNARFDVALPRPRGRAR